MDVAFQKSFFIPDFQDELTSPLFQSDETLNDTIRWVFETKLYLLTIALVSLFNIVMHLTVMAMWHQHGEMGYFWLALGILILNACGNSIIMSQYLTNNTDIQSNMMTHALCCCLCLPFALIFPYLLMIIPQRYFTQIDDVDDSERITSEHRLFTKKNRKFVSLIIQGYTQGMPQSVLVTTYVVYHISNCNEFDRLCIKLNLLSSVLVILQSLCMWKLTKYLDVLYNIINILCAVIDILLIYIMILFYYRCNAHASIYRYDRIIFNLWCINSAVGISLIFIFILSYFVLMQCTMMPQLHGCSEYFGFFCCISCFILIPYPILAALILLTMETMTYSWIIILVRMFCVGTNWRFIQFIVGTHLDASMDKEQTIYRLYHVNHMLTSDGKTDIDTDEFEKYLDATYQENKFIGIDSLQELKPYSWHEKTSIIHKYYNDYVYGVLGVNQTNGAMYKHHKPFTAVLISIYFVTRFVKLFFPFLALSALLVNYNVDETNNLLLYILSVEMLLILTVFLLFALCCKQIYYGFHVIYSTPHNKIYARSYIQFLATHRVLANIIKNEDIARIIILYCGHLQKIIPNCPGKHGLKETTSGGFHMCDICRQTVKTNDAMYSCRKCDFDVCGECYSTNDESTSHISPLVA